MPERGSLFVWSIWSILLAGPANPPEELEKPDRQNDRYAALLAAFSKSS